MANFIVSPNMSLVIPTPGVDPGPDYATNLQSSLTIIDQHNHSSGSGVQINPSGLNINASLPMNNNNLTLVQAIIYQSQSTSFPGSSPYLGCTYVAGNELYYNDLAGNVVKLTANGSVNSTSSGIASGTATASFSGGVLVVNSNTLTPANIQVASVLMGNNVASSNYLTWQPPSSLASNYSVTAPPSNTTAATVFMTYDASNNMGIGPAVTAGITGTNIASNTITVAKMAPPNIVISSTSGSFNGSGSGSPVAVTNLSNSITTTGHPVQVYCQNDGSGNDGFFGGSGGARVIVYRGATEIARYLCPSSSGSVPVSTIAVTDYPLSAGTYVYSVEIQTLNPPTGTQFFYGVLVTREW
jgi:hypothetical protein